MYLLLQLESLLPFHFICPHITKCICSFFYILSFNPLINKIFEDHLQHGPSLTNSLTNSNRPTISSPISSPRPQKPVIPI